MAKATITFNFRTRGPAEQDQIQRDFDDLINFFDLVNGGESTPSQITGDQNDYDPGSSTYLRISTDASRTITGFSGGEEGKHLWVLNVGSNDLVVANESASSSASNRVITGHGANLTVPADGTAHMWYDLTSTRWRVVGNIPSSWS